jgi:DUF1680 family protein
MPPRKVLCDPRVRENRDKAALMRGPVVYCVEGRDFTAVPYYAWCNRGPGPMRVWLADGQRSGPAPRAHGLPEGTAIEMS